MQPALHQQLARPAQVRRAGFTLIEILAVVLIVGILATILVVSLGDATDAAKVSMTESELGMLAGAIDQYENEFGEYPPSSFSQDQGVGNEGTNVGVEALVVALWSRDWHGGGAVEADELQNIDADRAPTSLSEFGRSLLEIVDAWDNPIAYIHKSDYEEKDRPYLTLDPVTGEEVLSSPEAFKNPITGRYYQATRFQLISAGSDGVFGTDDDITSFKRQ